MKRFDSTFSTHLFKECQPTRDQLMSRQKRDKELQAPPNAFQLPDGFLITVVSNLDEFKVMVKELKYVRALGWDTEASGFNYFRYLSLIQLATDEKAYCCVPVSTL